MDKCKLDADTFPPEVLFAKLKLLGRMFVFQQPVKLWKQEPAQEGGKRPKLWLFVFQLNQRQCCTDLSKGKAQTSIWGRSRHNPGSLVPWTAAFGWSHPRRLSGNGPTYQVQEMQVRSLRWEDPQKEMATHSSVLVWEIPWTEECGGLQSTGLESGTT